MGCRGGKNDNDRCKDERVGADLIEGWAAVMIMIITGTSGSERRRLVEGRRE